MVRPRKCACHAKKSTSWAVFASPSHSSMAAHHSKQRRLTEHVCQKITCFAAECSAVMSPWTLPAKYARCLPTLATMPRDATALLTLISGAPRKNCCVFQRLNARTTHNAQFERCGREEKENDTQTSRPTLLQVPR